MRGTVQDMAQRMAERDQAVAAELHSFQHQQLAKQEQQLLEARTAADAANAAAEVLRDALLAIHTALSPHSLAAALGFSEAGQTGLSLSSEGYEALTSRLLGGPQAVRAADGEAVAARVRELLAQVRGVGCSSTISKSKTTKIQHAAVFWCVDMPAFWLTCSSPFHCVMMLSESRLCIGLARYLEQHSR